MDAATTEYEQLKAKVTADLKEDAIVSDFGNHFTVTPNNRQAATKVSNYLAANKVDATVDMHDAPVRPIFNVYRGSPPASFCIVI